LIFLKGPRGKSGNAIKSFSADAIVDLAATAIFSTPGTKPLGEKAVMCVVLKAGDPPTMGEEESSE
jgi:hypothetical protein